MKDFSQFGLKIREFPDFNYKAIWSNLKTIRVGTGIAKELPPDKAEFYDVGIGSRCSTGNCPWCYVSASNSGVYWDNICELWKKWMSTFKEEVRDGVTYTEKPYQIAIGSVGSPTEHPQFCEFLETVYNTNVVPNYTTNGVILSDWNKPDGKYYELANKILEYTNKYVGGVAVSFGNELLRNKAKNAINGLIEKGNTHINIHHIISDANSVNEFIKSAEEYKDNIYYHVLLPLMPAGRSTKGIEDGVFEILENEIEKRDLKNVSFGAHFVDYLKTSKIRCYLYPPESLSKNVLLKDNKVVITPSSYNLEPVKIIESF
jgi:hypothetical protein